ncbi:MAG: hypothetical protein ABIT83_10340 [Massilia sp.]
MGHNKHIMHLYYREMGIALAIYVALLVGSLVYGRPMTEGPLRTVLLVMPMAGFGLMIWALARHVRRIDEYQRKFTLETFGIAAAVVAGASVTYGFLETAGFPKQSMFWVWPLMAAVWGVVGLWRAWANR